MAALESNLVGSLVYPRLPEISPDQLLCEVADQRQGADAVRDGGAEGAVGTPAGAALDPTGAPRWPRGWRGCGPGRRWFAGAEFLAERALRPAAVPKTRTVGRPRCRRAGRS